MCLDFTNNKINSGMITASKLSVDMPETTNTTVSWEWCVFGSSTFWDCVFWWTTEPVVAPVTTWTSCMDIKTQNAAAEDGTYTIDPENNWTGFEVYCDMTTDQWGYMLIVTLTDPFSNISGSQIPWNKWTWILSTTNFYSMDLSPFSPWTDWDNFMIKEWWWKWVAADLIETYNTYGWQTTRYTWTADGHILLWKVSWNLRWDVVDNSYINATESGDTIRWIKSCSNAWWCKSSWNDGLSIAYWSWNWWPCYANDSAWEISYWNAWVASWTQGICWWKYADPRWELPLTYWVK
jgi:hypothetical protein